jgi:DNA-binding phage protein
MGTLDGQDMAKQNKLKIDPKRIKEINDFFLDDDNQLVNSLIEVIEKYGGIEEINRKASEARELSNLMDKLESKNSPYVEDLLWLQEQRDDEAFIYIPEYRRKILGENADSINFDEEHAVTLEISACQYFPWLIEEAKYAIKRQDLMPGRFIRVRNMKEQVEDDQVIAFAAGMQIVGASYVETLDTKGTLPGPDGAPTNIHLGGPETITGYFGGVGMPNDFPLKWADEYLHYYTTYGVKQVLNINPGSVLVGYMMHKLGIDMEFKISVFMGNDNPYACLWTLLTANLFSRDDGTSPLIGFNLSNSVNNETIELAAYVREAFEFTDVVRIEHHITETYKHIVRQPYDRTDELVELADHVKNVSAKHEGGNPEIEEKRDYPSDILDYFRSKSEILDAGDMPKMLRNFLDKHDSLNRTARELTKSKLAFIAAPKLHKK